MGINDQQFAVWTVKFTGQARKQKEKLPDGIAAALYTLRRELEADGPERLNWPHYGKLRGKKDKDIHHCHLNKGKPRYVAVWKVTDREIRLIEVRYVGTHENADYRKIN
ncbi:MAG TPA: cytotoxic translational repressor of toxin-antitoxin stability system [Desulfobulbaceae bacterium]|nr:cytotoxic translational repressor of toxin-antitoxin stability system [Desulfobulbaceae bacterium]